MTLVHKVNHFPTSHAEFIYDLKEVLKSAGWTVTSSGTGTGGAYSASSDLIVSVATFTARARAWFVIREPSGPEGRSWCFQRGTTNEEWRVKISPCQGFTGGAPNANTVPGQSPPTDQAIIHGGGTDTDTGTATWAGPSGFWWANHLFGYVGQSGAIPENTYSAHIVADDTPHGPAGNQVYSFWAVIVASGTPRTFICQEALAVGSYPPLVGTRLATISGDADPAMYSCLNGGAGNQPLGVGFTTNLSNETINTFRYHHNYSSGVSNGLTYAHDIFLGDNASPEMSTTPSSRQDAILPIYIGRQAAPSSGFNTRSSLVGYKGCLKNFRRRTISRSTGTTITTAEGTYIYMDSVLLPWPTGLASRL